MWYTALLDHLMSGLNQIFNLAYEFFLLNATFISSRIFMRWVCLSYVGRNVFIKFEYIPGNFLIKIIHLYVAVDGTIVFP